MGREAGPAREASSDWLVVARRLEKAREGQEGRGSCSKPREAQTGGNQGFRCPAALAHAFEAEVQPGGCSQVQG